MRLTTPRIPPLNEGELEPEMKEWLQPWTVQGRYYNIVRTYARYPELMHAWESFGKHCLQTSALEHRHKELLMLRTAWLARSGYEFGHHDVISRHRGLTADDVDRVTQGPDHPGWTPLESALLRAADEIERDAFISDAVWQQLASELDERQLMDVIFTCGAYRIGSVAMNSFGVQIDEGIPLRPELEPSNGAS